MTALASSGRAAVRQAQSDIGRLVGFPGDYPWTHVGRGRGVRNKAQQAADAVCPMVSAAVFGRILGVEDWESKTRAYVHELYGTKAAAMPEIEQLTLFREQTAPVMQAA